MFGFFRQTNEDLNVKNLPKTEVELENEKLFNALNKFDTEPLQNPSETSEGDEMCEIHLSLSGHLLNEAVIIQKQMKEEQMF